MEDNFRDNADFGASNNKKLFRDFCILESRFLVSNDFGFIRDSLIELAQKGELHAMAKYLYLETTKNLDKEIVSLAKKLIEKPQKSPDEWEVLAAFFLHEEISVYTFENIKNTKDLYNEFLDRFFNFYETSYYFRHNRATPYDVEYDFNKFDWLRKNFVETKYAKAIKEAQIGRIENLKNNYNLLDAYMYLKNLNYANIFAVEDEFDFDITSTSMPKQIVNKVEKEAKEVYKSIKSHFKNLYKEGEATFVDEFLYNSSEFFETNSKHLKNNAAQNILFYSRLPLLEVKNSKCKPQEELQSPREEKSSIEDLFMDL